jgi:molybdate/tungstate transport system substrate-binding protein
VSWYVSFASAPLVIGYSPNSKFAVALKSTPWYQVITEPGFTLGRAEPTRGAQAGLPEQAFTEAAKIHHDPGLPAAAQHNLIALPEPEVVSQLKSGHLDAGFLSSIDAAEQNIPTISLDQLHLGTVYTMTVLNLAPDPAPAAAFVHYLLSPAGAALLKQDGLTVVPLTLYGYPTAVPPELRSALPTTAVNGRPANSVPGGQAGPVPHHR